MQRDIEITTYRNDEDVLFKLTSNPQFASIRLKQARLEMDGNFLNERCVYHYMIVQTLVIRDYNLVVGMKWKDIIGRECKLIVIESTTPFYAGQEGKINPRTGAKYIHTESNLPIYRATKITLDMSKVDELYDLSEITITEPIRNSNSEFSQVGNVEFERGGLG